MYRESEYLMLSGIQHFCFCKRQWALIHVEQQWADNGATMEGSLLHERADDPFSAEHRPDRIVMRAVSVSSAGLGLSGKLDILEWIRDENGICFEGEQGKWRPNIVEYKRGSEKPDMRDEVQLMAQAICLEEQYGCTIASCDLFYMNTHRRVTVDLNAELRRQTFRLAEQMHEMFRAGITPNAQEYRKCRLCSLVNVCLPRLTKKRTSVTNYVRNAVREDA